MIRLTVFSLLSFIAVELAAQYVPRLNFNAKLEPVDKILHGAGQADEIEFANYTELLGSNKHPIIYMLYTSASRSAERQIRFGNELEKNLKNYPDDVMPQIGLSYTGSSGEYANKVVDGTYDSGLIALAKKLDSIKRPVFVRIGYEANGFWNFYQPDSYKKAYIHISNIFKKYSTNVATVWCIHPIDNMTTIMKFYPGDEYADWWSIDLFETYHVTSTTTKSFLDSSVSHKRPVMIGESTPTKSGIGKGQLSWNSWYKPYFEVIQKYGVIKAFCYINRNWTQTVSWPDWKDARLEKDSIVARLYREELSKPIYQHATANQANIIKTIEVMEDAYVRNGLYASTNFGAEADLFVEQNVNPDAQFLTYLKFDITKLANIYQANLWLCGASDSTADGAVDIFEVENSASWTEKTLTWSNKPTLNNKLGSITPKDGNRISFRYLDLTNFIKDQLKLGRKQISLAIGNPSLNNEKYYFQAKEKPISNTAELVVIEKDMVTENSAVKILNNDGFKLYPNPSDGAVAFKSEVMSGKVFISVRDLAGKEVQALVLENNRSFEISFSINDLPTGMYFVRISDNNFYSTQKIFLNKN